MQFGPGWSQQTEWAVIAAANRLIVVELELGAMGRCAPADCPVANCAPGRFDDFKSDITDGRSVHAFEFYPGADRERPLIVCGATDGVIRLLDCSTRAVVRCQPVSRITSPAGQEVDWGSPEADISSGGAAPERSSATASVWLARRSSGHLGCGECQPSTHNSKCVLLHWLPVEQIVCQVVNKAPVHQLCRLPSMQAAALVFGFDGGLLGDGGSIATVTQLDTQPKVTHCTRLADKAKDLSCLAPCSHTSLEQPTVAIVTSEREHDLSMLLIDQDQPVAKKFMDFSSVSDHDQRSTVTCVAVHPLIDGVIAVGTSTGAMIVTYDILAAPCAVMLPVTPESTEILFIQGSSAWLHSLTQDQVIQAQQELDVDVCVTHSQIPVMSSTEAFTIASLANHRIDRCSGCSTNSSQWISVGSTSAQAWFVHHRLIGQPGWVHVATENCNDMALGWWSLQAMCYAVLKSGSVVVKQLSPDASNPTVLCSKNLEGATRLFTGPFLCVSQTDAAPPASRFYSWQDLSETKFQMPAAKSVDWESSGKYCALVADSNLHLLSAQDNELQLLHSHYTQVMSLFWFVGTLFYATPTEVSWIYLYVLAALTGSSSRCLLSLSTLQNQCLFSWRI